MIGILTFHNTTNFGASLQAYSLCKAIRSMGHECELVNYICPNIVKRERELSRSKNILKNIVKNILIRPVFLKKLKNFDAFIRDYTGKKIYTQENIHEAANDYDVLITGSDTIWNLGISGRDWTYFLDFKGRCRKYSYAASSAEVWSNDDAARIKELLSDYDMLSSRDEDTRRYIRSEFGLECEYVPDPTMLLDTQEFIHIATQQEQNYVFIYMLDEAILNAAYKYARKNNLKVIISGIKRPFEQDVRTILSVNEWLGYVRGAEAVFTNSYHGMLFSLYFRKPVWTNKKDSRLFSLLKRLDLESCFIDSDEGLAHRINYENTHEKLAQFREEGINFLERIIN